MWVNLIDKKLLTNRGKRGIMADGNFYQKKDTLQGVDHSVSSHELDRRTSAAPPQRALFIVRWTLRKKGDQEFGRSEVLLLLVTAMTH